MSENVLRVYFEAESANSLCEYSIFSVYLKSAIDRGDLVVGDPESADVFVCTEAWMYKTRQPSVQRQIEFARQYGKKIIMFALDDLYEDVPCAESVIVFRPSMYASSKKANEYAGVPYSVDFVDYFDAGELRFRDYEDRPTIGFCGFTHKRYERECPEDLIGKLFWYAKKWRYDLSTLPMRYSWMKYFGFDTKRKIETYLRGTCIDLVESSEELKAEFLLRDAYLDGMDKLSEEERKVSVERSRREYYENLVASDYVLCPRGVGNYSTRFYETLLAGRIPVFVNTDCVLPFEDKIDWRKHCVWVEYDELSKLPERVLEFHRKQTPQSFRDLQASNRKLYLEQLQPAVLLKSADSIIRSHL